MRTLLRAFELCCHSIFDWNMVATIAIQIRVRGPTYPAHKPFVRDPFCLRAVITTCLKARVTQRDHDEPAASLGVRASRQPSDRYDRHLIWRPVAQTAGSFNVCRLTGVTSTHPDRQLLAANLHASQQPVARRARRARQPASVREDRLTAATSTLNRRSADTRHLRLTIGQPLLPLI